MIDIMSLSQEELAAALLEMNEKPYRGKQIYQWLHKEMAAEFDEMTNLPKALRSRLQQEFRIPGREIRDRSIAKADGSEKFLIRLSGDILVESVLLSYQHGYSICISSQAGCRMGCKFCASFTGADTVNLTAGEMLAQVYTIQKQLDRRISNVVVMGTGEPLDNYKQTVQFVKLLTDPEGFGLSRRHITVSTCGLADQIYHLADENLGVTLAVSLHAPNDEIRQAIMPVARRYPIETLIKSCKYFSDYTKRRVTFAYTLMDGINDTKECAMELSNLLKGFDCHVNLIPLNAVKDKPYKSAAKGVEKMFTEVLGRGGISVTVRRSLGSHVDGACGQLRRRYIET